MFILNGNRNYARLIAPKKVAEAPKKVDEAPKKVDEAPKKVAEAPKKVDEAPKKVATKQPQIVKTFKGIDHLFKK